MKSPSLLSATTLQNISKSLNQAITAILPRQIRCALRAQVKIVFGSLVLLHFPLQTYKENHLLQLEFFCYPTSSSRPDWTDPNSEISGSTLIFNSWSILSLTTPFLVSRCLGIHYKPFLVWTSPLTLRLCHPKVLLNGRILSTSMNLKSYIELPNRKNWVLSYSFVSAKFTSWR